MLKTFKYRLYPSEIQKESLKKQLDGHRLLYNKALEERRSTYQQTGKGVSCFTQIKTIIPLVRAQDENAAACNYSSLQQTVRRVDKSFQAFFRRVKAGQKPGYPRFKSSSQFDTINYVKLGDGCQIRNQRLYLQNIGEIKVKWHRPIGGQIRTLSVSRHNDKWYVSFLVECNSEIALPTGKNAGIDVGLKSFIVLSDGTIVDPPKFFRVSERKLKQAQQKLSRRTKGSNRRRKAKKLVANVHEHISNQRLDFAHKQARKLVNQYDGFAVEDLRITNMMQNRHLSKSIADASWGIFLSVLKSKAENAGRWYREINPQGTSQICSGCGATVKKSLAVRIHACPVCGLVIDRDLNASKNILERARTEPSALTSLF